jgi:predicted ABC-type ATPase
MFAGPNGSGKSTLKSVLPKELLGVYLNPDEVEQSIRRQGFLGLASYGVTTTAEEVLPFFTNSQFLKETGHAEAARRLAFGDDRLNFTGVEVESYLASVASDFLRQKLLERKVSFTFETVMSHRSKVELLQQAQRAGYRTYLYFIATDDPEINISRVRNRVKLGGHGVPEDRIVTRYHRSLDLLMDAIRNSNRAYIFDNSTDDRDRTWLAEITEGRELEMKTDRMPAWFKRSVWDKINPPGGGNVKGVSS